MEGSWDDARGYNLVIDTDIRDKQKNRADKIAGMRITRNVDKG